MERFQKNIKGEVMCKVQKLIQICWQLLFSLDNAHCVNAGIYNKKQPPLKDRACPSDYQPPLVGFAILILLFRYFTPAFGYSYFIRCVLEIWIMLCIFNLFFAKAIGIVIGIMVLVFWFGTSCMRTWHGYGLSIGLSDPSLFTSCTKACALCSIT